MVSVAKYFDEGKNEGEELGDKLGISLGDRLGVSLGVRLGVSLGARLGRSLGVKLGISLGDRLGVSLTECVEESRVGFVVLLMYEIGAVVGTLGGTEPGVKAPCAVGEADDD